MSYYSPSIEKLIESFEKLPSIGHKTAARLAFHMLNATEEETNEFVSSIINAKKNLKYCFVGHIYFCKELLLLFFHLVSKVQKFYSLQQ